MMPALRRKQRRTRTTRRDGNEAVLDTFNGIDTVKGMHSEHPQEGFLVCRLDDAISAEEDSEDLRASMTQYNQFVNRLAIAGLLWFGASMVLDGQLTLGQLVAINILNMRFSQPMMRLCMFVYDFSQLRVIVKEVGEILNTPSERTGGPFIRLAEFKGAVRFEDVRFRYPGSDRDALDGITLEAELAAVRERMILLRQDIRQARERRARHTLVSPVAGVVQDFAVHTQDGVVEPGTQIMVVVPRDTGLRVEAFVSNDDVGFVRPGRPASCRSMVTWRTSSGFSV